MGAGVGANWLMSIRDQVQDRLVRASKKRALSQRKRGRVIFILSPVAGLPPGVEARVRLKVILQGFEAKA
jgi:hypothetical protein